MRVLLIEDDTATAQSIELMLKSEGYIVDITDLGEDGLEIGKIYEGRVSSVKDFWVGVGVMPEGDDTPQAER